MPLLLPLENETGSHTGFSATLDRTGHGMSDLVSLSINDPGGLRLVRGECSEHEFRSLAQGDWDSTVRLPLPEEKEFDGSPVAVSLRAYPLGMIEATFQGQVQYIQRSEVFEGLRTLFQGI